MLSKEEKQEMLKDARSQSRRKAFSFDRLKKNPTLKFEDYLDLLNDIQNIFAPFIISKRITITKSNKL